MDADHEGLWSRVSSGRHESRGPAVRSADTVCRWHQDPRTLAPTDENVTVLKGTFLVAMGESYDEAKLQKMSVGNFVTVPEEMRHFASLQRTDDRAGAWSGFVQCELGESVGSGAAGHARRGGQAEVVRKPENNSPQKHD